MNRIIVLDTEFIGLNKPFVYDLGYMVLDLKESGQYEGLKVENNITKQIYDNAMLFETAHYAEKRKLYSSLLKGKTAKRRYWGHIMQRLQNDIDTYDVQAVLAYNASADSKAIEYTCNFIGVANPLETVQVIDLLPIVQATICETVEYKSFANQNGLVNDSGFVQTSVEAVCKFLYDMPNFKEQHTALDDVGHEINLLNACMAVGAKIEKMTKKFIETHETRSIIIQVKDGEKTKNYTFKYRTRKNFNKRNTIVLTR